MKKETWWLIDSGARDPYYNMALDECLLLWHSEGRIPPVIRFYEWNPATLSIGYFQKINQEIDVDAVHRHELGLVRRPTGGRGVLHDQELTYSVIVSEEHPRMPATVTEAYRVISEGLLHGFRDLGLNAGFSIPESKEQTEALKNPRSSVCFDASSWYELVVEGVKLQGSAQTRQKGVILQHGAIALTFNEEQLFDLFIFKNARIREKMQQAFRAKAVGINDLTDQQFTIDHIRSAFSNGFETGLDIELKPQTLTHKEEEEVQKLANERYRSTEWLYRR
ncbi:LOW QUALITY PROTEIN: lipoate-protein ligase A [Geomicrobium sp. JCM 19037]|nr:LOW QUALITY PROTEIN: lipoate-protein ligase A [Geomicrobium sp. JCM 19037]